MEYLIKALEIYIDDKVYFTKNKKQDSVSFGSKLASAGVAGLARATEGFYSIPAAILIALITSSQVLMVGLSKDNQPFLAPISHSLVKMSAFLIKNLS